MKIDTTKLVMLRKKTGLNQEEFSDKCGIKRSTYSNWESGNRTPYLEDILKICAVLKVDPSEICLEKIPTMTQQINNGHGAVQSMNGHITVKSSESDYKKKVISAIAKSEIEADCKVKVMNLINEL